jgi:hypothetical protein
LGEASVSPTWSVALVGLLDFSTGFEPLSNRTRSLRAATIATRSWSWP